MTDILSTKLLIPRVPAERVPRPGLLRRMDLALSSKLTLVSAPAGYGKTTLLAEWASQLDIPVAWISLDEYDADVARFMTYVLVALRAVGPGIGQNIPAMLLPPRPAPMPTIVTSLINDLSSVTPPFVLILDDYHVIEAQSIHETILFLLDHLPPPMHLVIATRSDPPLQLARLRGRGELTDVRAADLQFSTEEASDFLGRVMGLGLTAQEVDALTVRTEGWIAGLHIAAMAMQGQRDILRMVRQFSGSSRHVVDYLLEEVLERQPESIQTFLLTTSLLDRLTGPLCDAVSGQKDCRDVLEHLEKANLFLVPLDEERRWYRYHQLFRDVLRQRLRQRHPDAVASLHRLASEWYEQNGLVSEAIEHSLAAGDVARSTRLIELAAEPALMRSEIATVLRWMDTLPDEVMRARPSLCVYHAWALLVAGRPIEAVLSRLQDAQTKGEPAQVSAEAAVFQALIAVFRGRARESLELSLRATAGVPQEKLLLRSIAASSLGMAYVLNGDTEAAVRAFEEAVTLGKEIGNVMSAVSAMSNLAGLCLARGKLYRAEAMYHRALELATDAQGRRLPVASRALLGLGHLSLQWNRMDAAQRYAEESLELSKQYGQLPILVAYLLLGRVRQAQGDFNGANEMIHEAEELASRTEATQFDDRIAAASRVRHALERGRLEPAVRWAKERGLDGEGPSRAPMTANGDAPSSPELQETEQTLLVRVWLAQGRFQEALELLDLLRQASEQHGWLGRAIELMNLEALARHAQGEPDQALASLRKALSAAESEGYVRVFLDEGEPMAYLLNKAASHGEGSTYARRLLQAILEANRSLPDAPKSEARRTEMAEPLSGRELEVLHLIADGLTNREIAERLVISLSTVKGHTANLYGKLGAKSRTQAVAQARTLGILSEG